MDGGIRTVRKALVVAKHLATGEGAEFREVELKAVVVVCGWIAVAPGLALCSQCRRAIGTGAAVERQTLAILSKLDLKTLDLRFEQAILVLVSFFRLA